MLLSLDHIFSFAKCTSSSRNLIEGDQVISSNQIILCGKVQIENEDCNIQIKCLVIQSSKLSDMPHEITGKICKTQNNLHILSFVCTCKAGASECCKHVVAVLLHLNRNHIEDIQSLSSTDITCQWSKLKEPSLDQYKPVPINDFCCVKYVCQTPCNETRPNIGDFIRKELITVCQKSALAAHKQGRTSYYVNNTDSISSSAKTIFSINDDHDLLTKVQKYPVMDLGDCCQKVFLKLAKYDVDYIRSNSEVDKSFWLAIRQFRITGSRCYHLYTYNQRPKSDEEWNAQASKYFWPKSFSNKFVKHGIQFEIVARELYAKNSEHIVVESGFITSKKVLWLGYSPDGVVLDKLTNTPIKLLEIKCPFKGKTLEINELLNNLQFLVKDELVLKKKHAYYAQVQQGMIMLNVTCCDFVVYSSFSNDYCIIPVELDLNYCTKLLYDLKVIYFEKLIHEVCIITDQL